MFVDFKELRGQNGKLEMKEHAVVWEDSTSLLFLSPTSSDSIANELLPLSEQIDVSFQVRVNHDLKNMLGA